MRSRFRPNSPKLPRRPSFVAGRRSAHGHRGRRLRTPGSRRSTNNWIRRSPFPFGIADSKDKIPSPGGKPGFGFQNWSGRPWPLQSGTRIKTNSENLVLDPTKLVLSGPTVEGQRSARSAPSGALHGAVSFRGGGCRTEPPRFRRPRSDPCDDRTNWRAVTPSPASSARRAQIGWSRAAISRSNEWLFGPGGCHSRILDRWTATQAAPKAPQRKRPCRSRALSLIRSFVELGVDLTETAPLAPTRS
jgi:hypothetical protein